MGSSAQIESLRYQHWLEADYRGTDIYMLVDFVLGKMWCFLLVSLFSRCNKVIKE